MGTNYYACRKMSIEDKKKAINLLNEEKYDELIDFINKKYSKIHIGKQSCGWQFLFNYNSFKYYSLNRKSINDFLSTNEIIDEYGNNIDIISFWNMVDSNIEKLNNITYYKSDPMLSFMVLEENIPLELKEYNVILGEFYSDGLRFSSYTEFS